MIKLLHSTWNGKILIIIDSNKYEYFKLHEVRNKIIIEKLKWNSKKSLYNSQEGPKKQTEKQKAVETNRKQIIKQHT